MNHKLDQLLKFWIYTLTFSAGFLNATAFIQYSSVVTHHTGTVTQAGIQLSNGNWHNMWLSLALIICYIMGAIISGLLFPEEIFLPRKRYSWILFILSFILFVMLKLNISVRWLLCYLSLMVGTQNGMFVTYRGMIIRTAHMSGTLTDIGLTLGRWLSGTGSEYKEKFYFHLFNFISFLSGCTIAGVFSTIFFLNMLYVTILFNLINGLAYFYLYRRYHQLHRQSAK